MASVGETTGKKSSRPVTRPEAVKVYNLLKDGNDEHDSDCLSRDDLELFFALIEEKQDGNFEGLSIDKEDIDRMRAQRTEGRMRTVCSDAFQDIMGFMENNGDDKINMDEFVMAYKSLDIQFKVDQRVAHSEKDGLRRPCILAHRGAPGYHAPHTLSGYEEAVEAGADYIEFDVISTKDGKLIICHDVTLEGETDVATKFPGRNRTEILYAEDGDVGIIAPGLDGYFAHDFTWEEVKTLNKEETWAFRVVGMERAKKKIERVQSVKSAASFLEKLRSDQHRVNPDRNFGLVIELKKPRWHEEKLHMKMEDQLLADLDESGFKGPIIMQCFEEDALRYLKNLRPQYSYMKLLIDEATAAETGVEKINRHTGNVNPVPDHPNEYDAFFEKIAEYADMVSPWKNSIVPNPALPPLHSDLVESCVKCNLEVMPYTFRTDVNYLHQSYGGNATEEYARFLKLGCSGCFTDFADHMRHARDIVLMSEKSGVVSIPSAFVMTKAGMARSTITLNDARFMANGPTVATKGHLFGLEDHENGKDADSNKVDKNDPNQQFVDNHKIQKDLFDSIVDVLKNKDKLPDQQAVRQHLAAYFQDLAAGGANVTSPSS